MYLFLGAAFSAPTSISLSCKAFADVFETRVILYVILLPIKSLVASAVFWIALFQAGFVAYVVDFLALSRSF